MSERTSRRVQQVKASATMAMTARALQLKREGRDIVSLSVGEPDFPIFPHVEQAVVEALRKGQTKYTAASGTPELREAISDWMLGECGVRYPIGQTRFAPYVWAGGGAIFGGGEIEKIAINDIPSGAFLTGFSRGTQTKAMGQFGGGFEVRLTAHIGWTNDFSWNVIEGSSNNFGMIRTGINFAF